jgi:periplasmic copper chaperone A
MRTFQSLTALGLLLCVCACGAPVAPPQMVAPVAVAGAIAISEPRVRLPANGRDQSAAYMTLTNQGPETDHLVQAISPDARRLELHAQVQSSDGMVAMREIDHIDIPAGTSMALTPGGIHIMVKGMKPDLKLGETMTIRLIFASGQSAQFQAPVVANPVALGESTREGPKSHQH